MGLWSVRVYRGLVVCVCLCVCVRLHENTVLYPPILFSPQNTYKYWYIQVRDKEWSTEIKLLIGNHTANWSLASFVSKFCDLLSDPRARTQKEETPVSGMEGHRSISWNCLTPASHCDEKHRERSQCLACVQHGTKSPSTPLTIILSSAECWLPYLLYFYFLKEGIKV